MKEHERFWAKVLFGDGCWEWAAYRNKLGYGVFGRDGQRSELAHRASWRLAHGDAGPLLVCHRCDNPSCVRPDHLFIGTTADNTADQISKGRKPSFPGAANGRAKLTAEQVAEIRLAYVPRHTRIIDLAAQFGVSKSQVWNIVSGSQWNQMP